jgi:hypothetical protein
VWASHEKNSPHPDCCSNVYSFDHSIVIRWVQRQRVLGTYTYSSTAGSPRARTNFNHHVHTAVQPDWHDARWSNTGSTGYHIAREVKRKQSRSIDSYAHARAG